jgi:pimeloyl-ACP methyl ester carboxylesterase
LRLNAAGGEVESRSQERNVRTGNVETEGDTLYYEVRGAGPPLLMIHGGVIDAGGFAFAADLLAAGYTVITYDRRAYSRSSGRDPQNFEVGQQARDAVAVLHAEGYESARVFGSSAGAIIGLEMAKSQPQAVAALVAHEPPVMRVLPEADQLMAEYASIYLAAWTAGSQQAFQLFTALNAIPRTEHDFAAISPEDMQRTRGNIEFFVKQEMLPLSGYKPDVAMIRGNGVKVALGVGELSRDKSYGRTAPILAEQLGCPLVVFPGHHVSYVSMAEEWVPVLRRALADG